MDNSVFKIKMSILAVFLILSTGCAIMKGNPSLTLLSRNITADSPNIKVVGPMDKESDRIIWCLVFLWFGKIGSTHEEPTTRLLEKYNADILVDAEMTTSVFGIPYIYLQYNFSVKGRPARFVQGGVQ